MSSKYPIDLKPCPFCGETPALLPVGRYSWAIECQNPKCSVQPGTHPVDEDLQAVSAWNTRKEESKP